MRHRQSPHNAEIERIKKMVAFLDGTVNVLSQGHRLRGSAGIPDLYIQLPSAGISLWFEVKVGKDRLSDSQCAFWCRERNCNRTCGIGDVFGLARTLQTMIGMFTEAQKAIINEYAALVAGKP